MHLELSAFGIEDPESTVTYKLKTNIKYVKYK